jgi:Na+/melibiose symporter-like transporter
MRSKRPCVQQHVDKLEQGDREGLQNGPKVSFEIATKHWRSLLICIGMVIATNVTYYMLLTYMPSYLSHNLNYSEDHGVLIIIAIMVGMLFCSLSWAYSATVLAAVRLLFWGAWRCLRCPSGVYLD